MTEKGFIPMSGELGIAGTSYRLQLGLINNKWASRMLKGKNILDSYVYKDAEISEGDIPNSNYVVGWVLRTITLPNVNPYGIMKTVQALIKQATSRKQEKKVIAPVTEAKKVELAKVPESEKKRPFAGPGWVKQEDEKTQEEELEERRQAFKDRVSAERAKETPAAGTAKVKKKRKLPTIPGATPQEQPTAPAAAAPSEETEEVPSKFCPFCGKELPKFCPHCGKQLPHEH